MAQLAFVAQPYPAVQQEELLHAREGGVFRGQHFDSRIYKPKCKKKLTKPTSEK